MKSLILILYVLCLLALGFTLLGWLMFHGSGHEIPTDTDRSFAYTLCILAALCATFYMIRRKLKTLK